MDIKALYLTNLGILDNLGQTQILPYLQGLSRKGIKIYVLSFEKKENLDNVFYVKSVEKKLKDLHIEWERLLYHRRWGNLWDMVVGFVKTLGIVRDKGISILHARATIPVLIAWPIAKIMRRKIIYDRRGTMVGDFVDDVNIENMFSIRFFSSIVNAIDRFIVRHSDAVIVLSKRAFGILKEDQYFSDTQEAIKYVPCCTDMSRFKGNNTKEGLKLDLDGRLVMTYVGSLGTCYLFNEMCEFFRVLKQEKKNAIFLIISHTDKGFIKGILKKQGLSPDIDYVILKAGPDEVPAYLARSDFSIMFVKDVDCKIGSSPTKFGESLAAGVPVIANKGIGDTEDIVNREKVGVIADGLNAHSYKKAISEAFALLGERGDLKNRCIETADKYFSLDLGIEKYAKIYSGLL